MNKPKEQFIDLTGGFRLGETDERLKVRTNEINHLQREILNPSLSIVEREIVQRRLCELRGECWDEEDEWELG